MEISPRTQVLHLMAGLTHALVLLSLAPGWTSALNFRVAKFEESLIHCSLESQAATEFRPRGSGSSLLETVEGGKACMSSDSMDIGATPLVDYLAFVRGPAAKLNKTTAKLNKTSPKNSTAKNSSLKGSSLKSSRLRNASRKNSSLKNISLHKNSSLQNSSGKKKLKAASAAGKFHGNLSANGSQKFQTPWNDRMAVWVTSYPRSASSTVLSMVSATVEENTQGGRTFSLFEPCHIGDEYGEKSCVRLLLDVASCNFSLVEHLWGWNNRHSTNGGKDYDSAFAREECLKSRVVAFKTVNFHDLRLASSMFNEYRNSRIIDVIRDPRGIFASWKTTPGFENVKVTPDKLTAICKIYSDNLDVEDWRITRVVFEKLVDNPETVTKAVYDFMQLPYGNDENQWVQKTFGAVKCDKTNGYADCHGDGDEVKNKWREVLTKTEMKAFRQDKYCRRIANVYGFPVA